MQRVWDEIRLIAPECDETPFVVDRAEHLTPQDRAFFIGVAVVLLLVVIWYTL